MKVAIVDYGAGNLTSVLKAFYAIGTDPFVARAPADTDGAAGIVVPGVGHFGATRALGDDWRALLRAPSVPLLGICLGMQLLFDGSDEAPDVPGLGFFSGRIARMRGGSDPAIKIPHVGWNTFEPVADSPLFANVEHCPATYFTHSFAAPVGPGTLAVTTHGAAFASIVDKGDRGNGVDVCGMQFHPEKSGRAGLTLLRNWVRRCSASA